MIVSGCRTSPARPPGLSSGLTLSGWMMSYVPHIFLACIRGVPHEQSLATNSNLHPACRCYVLPIWGVRFPGIVVHTLRVLLYRSGSAHVTEVAHIAQILPVSLKWSISLRCRPYQKQPLGKKYSFIAV